MTDRVVEAVDVCGNEGSIPRTPARYSPERAARLVTVNQALWAELKACAATMRETLSADSYFGRWRTRVRMLEVLLESLTPEFESFLKYRSTLSDRDDDESYKVIQSIEETVDHLLERIDGDRDDNEEYLVNFMDEDFETGIGVGFMAALERFKDAYQDWDLAWSMMDNIDAAPITDDPLAEQNAFDKHLGQLTTGLAKRAKQAGV